MRNTSVLAAVVTAVLPAAAAAAETPLPRGTPESQGVPSAAVRDFVAAADQIDTPHGFVLVRHGHVVADGYWKPAAADVPHVLNSVSKSFTATAVGMAVAEGKLTLGDPVLKFFPDEAPADPSANLKAMTVRDLLTMTCGHDDEIKYDRTGPTVRAFLAHPVPHAPGTHFQYNTAGTYVLSAIVAKVTGQQTAAYLQPRLFDPLGIDAPRWDASPEGTTLGGYGLFLRAEDVAKLGQLYLRKGKWADRQLLPADWVATATAKQVENAAESHAKIGPDWTQGYGFQFWRCRHNAYRGDGAGGQFCLVMPDQDAVVAITADTGDMQGELNAVWDHLLPAMADHPLPEDAAAAEQLRAAVADLKSHPKKGK